jgi:penicillin-binding protein 2
VRNIPRFTVTIAPAYLPDDPAAEEAVFQRLCNLLALPDMQAKSRAIAQELGMGAGEIAAMGIRSIQERVDEARDLAPYRPLILKRNVDRATVFQIEESHLDLPGVLVELGPIRQYPHGELLSHLAARRPFPR